MIKERLRLFRTAAQWLVAALSLMASVAGNASELNALRDFVSEANKDPASYAIIIRHALAPGTGCLLYTSPSPRDLSTSRMPSSA